MSWIYRFFHIRTDEVKMVRLLVVLMFSSYFYFTVQDIVTFSVFIARTGTSFLPYMYMILAALLLLFALFAARFFLGRVNAKLFAAVMASILLLHLINFVIIRRYTGVPVLNFFMLSSSGIVYTVMLYMISLVLQDLLDIDSAKRIVPVVTAGGIAGAIGATLFLQFAAAFIPLDIIFLLTWIPGALTMWASLLLLKRFRRVLRKQRRTASPCDIIRYLADNPFYIMLTLFGTMLLFSFWINDYLVNSIIQIKLIDEERISLFYSRSELLYNALTLVLYLFLLSPILRRMGTLRSVYLVLGAAAAGALLLFNPGSLPMVMGSRVLFYIFIIETVTVIYQLLYQPVRSDIKPAVILFLQFIIRGGGLFLAGIASLMGTLGLVTNAGLTLGCLAFILIAAVLWALFNPLFLKALKNSLQTGESLDLGEIMGGGLKSGTLESLLQELLDKPGNSGEVILELLKKIEPQMRDPAIRGAMSRTDISFRLKLIDAVFGGELPDNFLFDLQHDPEVRTREYLVYQSFTHYEELAKRWADSGRGDHWSRYIAGFGSNAYEEITTPLLRGMLEYLKGGSHTVYHRTLRLLAGRLDDTSALAVLEVVNHNPSMKQINARLMPKIFRQHALNPEILRKIGTMDLFNKASRIFERYITNFYQYNIIQVVRFPLKKALAVCEKHRGFLARLYLIHLATRDESADCRRFLPMALRLLQKCAVITAEELKIRPLENSRLLSDELAEIRKSALAVLLDFFFKLYALPRIEGTYQKLDDPDEKRIILEIVHNSFPAHIYQKTCSIIKEDLPGTMGGADYAALDMGLSHSYLKKIYCYLGGVRMEDSTKNQIEKLFVLKNIPMFAELDLMNLIRVSEISRYMTMSAGEALMREGEQGDKFYVVIRGSVDIIKKGKVVDRVGCGGILGELGIIDRTVRSATVIAVEELLLLVVDGDDLTALLKKNAAISYSVISTLSSRLRGLLERG